MTVFNYDGRVFRSVATSENGDVGSATRFHYHQLSDIVWAEYSGGAIERGQLIARAAPDGTLDMRYHHVNADGDLMTGECISQPELLGDGRIRLRESWQWTSGDRSVGESIVESES